MKIEKREYKMSLKKGVNTSDKAKMRAMMEQGATAQEISDILRVELRVIEWFFPKPKPKPKKKAQPKPETDGE